MHSTRGCSAIGRKSLSFDKVGVHRQQCKRQQDTYTLVEQIETSHFSRVNFTSKDKLNLIYNNTAVVSVSLEGVQHCTALLDDD